MRAGIGASIGLAAAWAAPAPAAHVPLLCDVLGIARRLELGSHAVGLTFDDGPHGEGTPAILAVLAAAGAQATFFVVGEQVRRDPGIVREVVAAGHRLAVHGDRHRLLTLVGPRALRADLDRCAELVTELGGCPPECYRPPFGVFTPAALLEARRRGWTPLLWSAWGRDWRSRATGASITAGVTGAVRGGGDVVLLHDADHYSAPGSWRATAAALPGILDALAARGLRAVAV